MSFRNVLEDLRKNYRTRLVIGGEDVEFEWDLDKYKVENLAAVLKDTQSLEDLIIKRQAAPLGDSLAENLSAALVPNRSVVYLALEANSISGEALEGFSLMLQKNVVLVWLSLMNNQISDEGCMHIAKGLGQNTGLKTLYLNENHIGNEGMKYLSKALKVNKTLQYLDLGNNHISCSGSRHLAESLKVNQSLSELVLDNNSILSDGARHIADALMENRTLTFLDLSRNNLGNAGAKVVAQALKVNEGLVSLNLRDISITNEGDEYIAEALSVNMEITTLKVFHFGMNVIVNEAIDGYLRRNEEEKHKIFLSTLNGNQKAPWNRSRLMFVGQGGVGKSCTIRALLGKDHVKEWDSTVGVEVSEVHSDFYKSTWKDYSIDDIATKFAANIMLRKTPSMKESNASQPLRKKKEPTAAKSNLQISKPSSIGEDVEQEKPSPRKQKSKSTAVADQSGGAVDRHFDWDSILDAYDERDAIKLSIWDFGGQKIFYAMHHIFMTESGVYVLVFDVRKMKVASETRKKASKFLSFWVRSIKLHAPLAPVLVIGTFSIEASSADLLQIDSLMKQILSPLKKQLVFNDVDKLNYFPIDNPTYVGVNIVRQYLEQTVQKDSFAKDEVSIRWIVFLDELMKRRQRESFLYLAETHKIGLSVGLSNRAEVDLALSLFHERGVLLHFCATNALRNIVILEPQFLMEGLGKVIRDGELHHFSENEIRKHGLKDDIDTLYKSGVASKDILEFVWPHEHMNFFIDFMQRTMLLSEWNYDHEVQYLIPSLILEKHSGNPDGVRMILDFKQFLPVGVFQRLICLLIAHSSSMRKKMGWEAQSLEVPELFSNFATVEIEPGFVLHLQEEFDDKESDHGLASQRIVVVVRDFQNAGKSLGIIQAMLRKVNYDAMRAGLKWTTLLEDPEHGRFVSYEEALRTNMPPWCSSEMIEKETRNVSIDAFLNSL
mmetsp:Transcript_12525/g.14613  ORF Transcript_12525/g.14613 Transcript_12525/m.14613 type:complete len:946 (-) Transcript_12525:74-2911(-)|eukprot:CAMPEP_0184026506 /NCGR_PEP_ID=MMETSP0954-20121128/13551_1 /TAXON_ID=627963 /ORGANISM="Aplanochytrium sp, Strain PBS07" /LENGTH=945 /DNA_ID=CAMNT_0026310703 /DNA_START=74 /DNA_END=2911 /DNA_ORIENTATION=-